MVMSVRMISKVPPLQTAFPKIVSKMEMTTETLQELREEAWPYIPAKLSDEDFETLLTRLENASKVKKYIFRYRKKDVVRVGPTRWCGNCEMTYDPEMILHPETKAVVIHYKLFNKRAIRKTNRRSDQLYVWFTLESPESLRSMRRMTLKSETEFKFNLTVTYRRDSGIYNPYGRISDVLQYKWKQGIHKNISLVLKRKTKLSAAVISNCGTTSGARTRLQIIKKMKQLGLEVDTLGKCYGRRVKESDREFEKMLEKYKFFLSFENAFHCRDYITEKFMINGYRAGTVPVVLGATKAEYEAVAPKGSFIFVEDFTTVASLVNYLKYLDDHDEEYLKYFRWIEAAHSLLPEPKGAFGFCRLCRQIHGINIDDMIDPNYYKSAPGRPMFTDGIAPRTVKDLRKWFYDTENNKCFQSIVHVL